MLTMNDLRVGTFIQYNNEAYEVVSSSHMQTGRGSAVMRTKLRNLVTGATLEHTFKASEKIEDANLTRSKATYLYEDDESLHFMDQNNFEQFFIPLKSFEDKAKYLKESLLVDVLLANEAPVTVKIPTKVEYEVKEAPPGVKGDTQGNVYKTVILENDLEIRAPLFINKGDTVRVNTDNGEYTERVT